MHKMILSLMVLMVLMLACVVPAMACDGCGINESGTYLNAQIDQADLVDTLAVVGSGLIQAPNGSVEGTKHNLYKYTATVPRSSEVLHLAYTEQFGLSLAQKKRNTAGTLLVATYNPGHRQFDYGEFTLLPQLE